MSFRTTSENLKINRKPLEMILDKFCEKNFFRKLSANSQWIYGIFLFLSYNKLFTGWVARAVPSNTKPLSFYARTSQACSVLQNFELIISRYGPRIRLINSKYCYFLYDI